MDTKWWAAVREVGVIGGGAVVAAIARSKVGVAIGKKKLGKY